MIHNFEDSLRKSQNPAHEQFWQDCYRNEFGDQLVAAFPTGGLPSEWQRAGIDRVVLTKNGGTYYIDEKLRDRDFGDILLEYGSVAKRRGDGWEVVKPGWAVDPRKRCDFILYAIPSAQKYWFLPYHGLRNVTMTHIEEWKSTYRPIVAQNQDYCSLSVAVPWDTFFRALVAGMKRELKIARLPVVKKLLKTHSKGGGVAA